jgi:hypothetical protein
MKSLFSVFFIFLMLNVNSQTIESPNKNLQCLFRLDANGVPKYEVLFNGKIIVSSSSLGIELKDSENLDKNFNVESSEIQSVNESWNPVLGEQKTIQNKYNQITFHLKQKVTNRKLDISFKIFDEGVAFRYEFPKQENLNYFIISDEKTQFNLTQNYTAFWIPGDFDSQEYVYSETLISDIITVN